MQLRNVCAYIDPRTRTDHLTLSQFSAALMPAIHHRPPSYQCAGRRRLSAFENRLEADICHRARVIWSRTPICGIYERQQNLIGVQFTLRVCAALYCCMHEHLDSQIAACASENAPDASVLLCSDCRNHVQVFLVLKIKQFRDLCEWIDVNKRIQTLINRTLKAECRSACLECSFFFNHLKDQSQRFNSV